MTTAPHRVPAGTGFWIVAAVFLAVMSYTTIPTPLYPLYESRDDFSVTVVTIVFAAYAVGVVFALFFLGHVSDWAGRRRMLLIAVAVSFASAVVFLVFPEAPGLVVARFVNGASVGILSAAATAWLAELRAQARPTANPRFATSIAGAANLGGLALGPLIGGVFADLLPAPLVLPHAVYLVVFAVAAAAVALVPETVTPPTGHHGYRPQRLAAPPRSRATFVAAGFGAFAGFAMFGLFTALAPSLLATTFDDPDHLAAGAVAFAVFAASAIGQLVLTRLSLRVQLTIAAACCGLGLAAVAAGAVLPSLALFVGGGVISGAGVGVLFTAALATVSALAEPSRRGETLALTFLMAYCGPILPVLAIGAALRFAPEPSVVLVFTGAVLVVTVVAALVMRRRA